MKNSLTKKHKGMLALAVGLTLLLSLSVSSFADGKMRWYYPESSELSYHWEYEKNVQEVQFNDVAMCIEFDVADSGRQHLIKAGWLPEQHPGNQPGARRPKLPKCSARIRIWNASSASAMPSAWSFLPWNRWQTPPGCRNLPRFRKRN